ncbi:MAG: hypothetical protein SangKO_082430 [Sandaracinaceae bacterium]
MRASYTQSSVRMTERLPPEEARRVVAAVRDETWSAIRSASSLAFLDMRMHLEVDAALYEVLGRERYAKACARLTLELMQKPLFAPVTRGRLLRGHPERLLRRLPMTWALIFRDVGQVEVDDLDGGLRLSMRDLPVLVRHDEAFLVGVMGTLEGVGEACGVHIDVAVDETQRGLGAITLRLRW